MPLRCKASQLMMMLRLPHFRRKISHLPVPSEAKKVNKPEDRRRRLSLRRRRRPNALFHSTNTHRRARRNDGDGASYWTLDALKEVKMKAAEEVQLLCFQLFFLRLLLFLSTPLLKGVKIDRKASASRSSSSTRRRRATDQSNFHISFTIVLDLQFQTATDALVCLSCLCLSSCLKSNPFAGWCWICYSNKSLKIK